MTSVPEIARRFINGQWQTGVAEDGGGGSQSLKTVVFPFAFDTPNLVDGVVAYTPNVIGERLLNAYYEVVTAWNGTTPLSDIGTFVGSATGLFANGGVLADLTNAESENDGAGLAFQSNYGLTYAQNGNGVRFTALSPLKLVVSRDGMSGGAAPGATHGEANLVLLIAIPA